MIKHNKWMMITSILILIPIAVGLILWDRLPDPMPMHWNMNGEVDNWGSKTTVVIFLPLFLLAVHWICMIVTCADPKNKNINGKPLQLMFWICPFISLLCCNLIYALSMGYDISIETLMPLILGGMFLIIGNYLPKCKRNYTMGIKVPWALDNDENWNATHRFAGKVWVIGGAVIMATGIFKFLILFFVIALVMVIAPTLYSYLYYIKHSK